MIVVWFMPEAFSACYCASNCMEHASAALIQVKLRADTCQGVDGYRFRYKNPRLIGGFCQHSHRSSGFEQS